MSISVGREAGPPVRLHAVCRRCCGVIPTPFRVSASTGSGSFVRGPSAEAPAWSTSCPCLDALETFSAAVEMAMWSARRPHSTIQSQRPDCSIPRRSASAACSCWWSNRAGLPGSVCCSYLSGPGTDKGGRNWGRNTAAYIRKRLQHMRLERAVGSVAVRCVPRSAKPQAKVRPPRRLLGRFLTTVRRAVVVCIPPRPPPRARQRTKTKSTRKAQPCV